MTISDVTFTDYQQANTHLARWSIALELAEIALITGPSLVEIDPAREDLGEALDDLSIEEQHQVMQAAEEQTDAESFGSALIEASHRLVDTRSALVPFPSVRAVSRDLIRDAYADNPAKRYALEAVAA